ncbi:MAG: pyridoxamine 5'-phosphate oxidase family protein [Turneriella sp.]|nr:pyridoxamine 5'-phosphate oxidase family protein [Turneriella sp.]
MDGEKLEAIRGQMQELLRSCQSLLLASVSDEGIPHASYAPVVFGSNSICYIHISELAKHYHNLNANGRVSALFIEDEKDAGNIFARKRLTLEGHATKVDKGETRWAEIMDLFAARFGEFFNQSLRNQGDFHTFELSFDSGTLVLGFGAAYRLSGEELGQIDWLRGAHGREGVGLAQVR